MQVRQPPLSDLFSPRGVAVVGASQADRASFATHVIRSLKEAGFPAIYPVNPKHREVLGLPCYPSLMAIPGVVDHVVVSIPAELALGILDECAAKGVKSVHFFTAGFRETGEEKGAELERAMLAKARAGGFRIIGPNCVGLFVPKSRLVTATGMPLEPGPVAFISQSGGHAHDVPYYGAPRGLRFSKVVSYGNALDVDECELLEYLSEDPETEVIAAYIEGVKDGKRFLRALEKATRRKPVAVYKGGTTDAGLRAAHGHTASLTSSTAVFGAACRQANAIQADDVETLVDVVVALRFAQPLPRGTGAAVVGLGGGPSVLASDEMEKAGLRLPALSEEVRVELKQFLPEAGAIFGNPVDATTLLFPEAISKTMRVLARVPEIDMLVYHLGFHPVSRWGAGLTSSPTFLRATIDALTDARQATGKPVLLALRPAADWNGMKEFLAAQDAFVEAEFPVFHSLRQAGAAMSRVAAWNRS